MVHDLFPSSTNQRHEAALCEGVAFDVTLGGFDRPMPGQYLNIAEACSSSVSAT
ncbi:MAG: hypothetical protein ACI9XZ_002394, partial [Alphaproteobacteria bacterium]